MDLIKTSRRTRPEIMRGERGHCVQTGFREDARAGGRSWELSGAAACSRHLLKNGVCRFGNN